MKLARGHTAFILLATLALAGCGGNVVVDRGEGGGAAGTGGPGGVGGAPLGATHGPSTTASVSAASTGSGAGASGSSSSSGTNTTTTGATTSAGTGGSCTCPVTSDACSTGVCSEGVTCDGTAFAPIGTKCGHTSTKVCDGAGSCVQCNTVADCPAPYTSCDVWTCAGHHCKYTPAPKGTVCGPGAICDKTGGCRGCNTASDCPSPPICQFAECAPNHVCETGTMPDGMACVGADGSAGVCANFTCSACAQDSDCGAGRVCESYACYPATCKDGLLDDGEADIDCGGPCPPCAAHKSCTGGADCKSNHCFEGKCH